MKISWNPEEKKILSQLTVPFNAQKDLSADEMIALHESVDNFRWTHEGYDGIGEPGKEFLICEGIMDKIEDVWET